MRRVFPFVVAVLLMLPAVAFAGGKSPRASFTVSPSNPTVGQEVTFDASTSLCFGAGGWLHSNCATFKWDDDADTNDPLDDPWPLGTGSSFKFTFGGAGTKYVWLTLTDGAGRSTQTSTPVVVAAASSTPTPTPTATPTVTPDPTITPEPTATPTPTPTQGSNCFPSPGACGYPDPAFGNVGVPEGTSLTPSGSFTVTTPGAVIDSRDVAGKITVNADNVTIRNTRVVPPGPGCGGSSCGNSAIELDCVCTLTISYVELYVPSGNYEFGVRNDAKGTLLMDHIYHHGNIDALCWCDDATLTDSYSQSVQSIPGDHVENIYTDDASITVRHNTLRNSVPQTANIFANTGNGFGGACRNHLTVTDNLFAGGGFTIYPCGNASSQGTSTATITGNRFARCGGGQEVQGGGGTWFCPNGPDSHGYFPRAGSFGRLAASFGNTVWSGNVWDDSGTPASGN